MTHDLTTPAKTLRAKAPQAPDPRAERPGIVNADVPSDTLGLPGVGEGASATHFARDTVGLQANDGDERDQETDDRAPADPRDGAG